MLHRWRGIDRAVQPMVANVGSRVAFQFSDTNSVYSCHGSGTRRRMSRSWKDGNDDEDKQVRHASFRTVPMTLYLLLRIAST